jgi:hypothetical protein
VLDEQADDISLEDRISDRESERAVIKNEMLNEALGTI